MVPFTYRCPRTGLQVQGWVADDLIDGETYESVTCTACGRAHLVNSKSLPRNCCLSRAGNFAMVAAIDLASSTDIGEPA